MQLYPNDIAGVIDISAVQAPNGEADIRELAKCAKEYGFIGVHALPCWIPFLCELLSDRKDINVCPGSCPIWHQPSSRCELVAAIFHFIGVTTANSSIMRVFPHWASYLNLGNCEINGIDFRPHDKKERYREALRAIKKDPKSLGALVTTHKIDLYTACRGLFDKLDPYARLMGEVSCISKRGSRFIGHAKDPISSGLAIEAFLPKRYWEHTGAALFCMGAGGSASAIALTSYLMNSEHGPNRPAQIFVSNCSRPRLTEIERIHQKLNVDISVEYLFTPATEDNDAIVNQMVPYSVVINATGLGKDAPGSPITGAAKFPQNGIVWDLNYRGDLILLKQAKLQQKRRNLQIEDGWVYFIHGWTRVVAQVFNVAIPVKDTIFDDLSKIASQFR